MRISKSFVLLFFIILFQCAHAQKFSDPKLEKALRGGIYNLINQQYAEAENKFARLAREYPKNPIGDIYYAAAKIAHAEDYGIDYDDNSIRQHLKRAEDLSTTLLASNDNAWNNYFMALAKGYLAYYQAIRENYVTAFANGMTSVNYFEKCIKLDSSFTDAYVAIGTYKYWKSEKSEFLKWLPFIEDERDKAIRYLIKAELRPTYNQYLAAYSLVWVFINKKEYRKAIEYSNMISRYYPSSRFFKWGLARAYESIDCIKSACIYGEILNSLQSVGVNNHYQEIILKHKMAMMYKRGNNRDKALSLCKEILAISQIPQPVRERLGNRLERVKKLYYELSQNSK